MKKFYITRVPVALLILMITSIQLPAQIIPGGAPARFGIDADVKSNQHTFGTSMPAATGSDDWFTNTGGTGVGVIDTTGATAIKTALQGGANFLFERPMAFPKFTAQNGIVLLDARYAHDNVGIDSTTFTQGKNADDPTTWGTSPNGSAILDKSDIIDTYIHLRRNGTIISGPNPSPLILIMGGSVYSSTGNHYMDFELFKSRMQYDKTTGRFSNTGPSSTGGHTRWEFRADGSVSEIGDMQVSFSFSNANVSSLNIYIWTSLADYNSVIPKKFDFVANGFYPGTIAGYGYAEISAKLPAALPVWGIVNSTGVSEAPFWGTNSKSGGGANGYTSNYGTGEFAEVAIDFTALGIDPAFNPYNNPCNPPFSRMMAKTRSSASFSAALKDFTGPYEFVDDPMVSPALIPPTWLTCYVPTVNINPVTVYPSPAVYEWSTADGNIATRTDSTAITVDKKGTYILKTRSYKGCSSLSDSVFVDADLAKPTVSAGGPYYITNKNPNALLKGNSTSNNSSTFGPSQGLLWQWKGTNVLVSGSQTLNASDTGIYMLSVTEVRNGCMAEAPATVMMLNTLPVKLSNFTATLTNTNNTDIKWSVNGENASESYSLERSTDGINFKVVYNTQAISISNVSTYSFRDDITGLGSNMVYYRMKIYSHSVLYAESNIIRLNIKDFSSQPHNYIISVAQNANDKSAIVNYYAAANSIMSLMICDVSGKIIYQTQKQVTAGINNIELPSESLSTKGMKVIQLRLQTDKLNYKFIN